MTGLSTVDWIFICQFCEKQ